MEIPVVVAGGIYDSADVKRVMDLGADGVQGGDPFCHGLKSAMPISAIRRRISMHLRRILQL